MLRMDHSLAKTLALILCLAVPLPSFAGPIADRFSSQRAGAPQVRAHDFQREMGTFLDTQFPEGDVDYSTVLRNVRVVLDDPAPEAGPRKAALMLFLDTLASPPESAASNLANVDLPAKTTKRLIDSTERMRKAAGESVALSRQLTALVADEVLAPKAALPQKAQFHVRLARMAAGFGRDKNARPDAAWSSLQKAAKDSPVSNEPQVFLKPSYRWVGELHLAKEKDPESGRKAAVDVLNDPKETRFEVRITALRILDSMDSRQLVPVLLKEIATESDWALQREAIMMLGRRLENRARLEELELGHLRAETESLLRAAYRHDVTHLRLAAAWTLGRLGLEPGPERPWSFSMAARKTSGLAPKDEKKGLWKRGWQRLKSSAKASARFAKATGYVLLYYGGVFAMIAWLLPWVSNLGGTMSASELASVGSAFAFMKTIAISMLVVGALSIALSYWNQHRQAKKSKTQNGTETAKAAASSKSGKRLFRKERPTTRFSDVAGADDAVVDMAEAVEFLKNPEKFRRMGGKMPRGICLIGPPGTGKTLIARAVAGEAGVPIFTASGSDFVDTFVGVGASRIREMFDEAKKNSPAIIFVDEIDAVGRARSNGPEGGGNEEREQTLNQLLVELDGFDENANILFISATNRFDLLDPALKRSGRFDRQVHVTNVDVLGREAQLWKHAKNIRLAATASLRWVAQRTFGFPGADLEGVLNEAALLATRRGADAVEEQDLDKAIAKKAMGGERNLNIPRELKERVAKHEVGHVLGMIFAQSDDMPNYDIIPHKVTNIPHGNGAMGFAEPNRKEGTQFMMTEPELEAEVVGLYGGTAAEETLYGNKSTGPGSDIERATTLVKDMIEKWGMGRKSGIAAALRRGPLGMRDISEWRARKIDQELDEYLVARKKRAMEIMKTHAAAAEALFQALMQDETLIKEQIEDIVKKAEASRRPAQAR